MRTEAVVRRQFKATGLEVLACLATAPDLGALRNGDVFRPWERPHRVAEDKRRGVRETNLISEIAPCDLLFHVDACLSSKAGIGVERAWIVIKRWWTNVHSIIVPRPRGGSILWCLRGCGGATVSDHHGGRSDLPRLRASQVPSARTPRLRHDCDTVLGLQESSAGTLTL